MNNILPYSHEAWQNARRASEQPQRVVRLPGKSIVMNSSQRRTGADVEKILPPIRDPRLNVDQYFLPPYDASSGMPSPVLNAWIEHYYKWHPLVGNAIAIHSELPISRFALTGVKDPTIQQVYERMAEDMDLLTNMYRFLTLWWVHGEVFPYLWWGEDYNRFVDMSYLDPSNIRVYGHSMAQSDKGDCTQRYELVPDAYMVNLIKSPFPMDREIASKYIDQEIHRAVNTGMNIELDSFSTELVAHKAFPWELRGTSIILGVIKDLIYEDSLRQAQNAIAQTHITPKWLWKLGQAGPDGYMPTDQDLQDFRDLLITANNDPMFSIITHYAVSAEVIGSVGKIMPLKPEYDYVEQRILTRLFMSKALTTSEGITYSNASVGIRVLMSRYLPVRAMMEDFFYRKVFLPVALANEFFERKQADLDHKVRTTVKAPIYPQFNWRHKQSLLDDSAIKSALIGLRDKGDVPLKLLCDALDIDYEETLTWLEKEQGTLADRHLVSARSMWVTRMAQNLKGAFNTLVATIKNAALPRDEEAVPEPESEDASPEAAPPTGATPGSGTDSKPPTSPKAPAPKAPGTKSPLGGEAGEKVEGQPTKPGPTASAKNQQRIDAAKRKGKRVMKLHPAGNRHARAVVDHHDLPLNEWQVRLQQSRMDAMSKRDVIGAEENLVNIFDQHRNQFITKALELWRRKDSLSIDELQHALREAIDNVNTKADPHLRDKLKQIYERSSNSAADRLKKGKRGRRYLKRRASLIEEHQKQLDSAIDSALQRVTTVSSEVIDKIRQKMHDNPSDIPSDIVKDLFADIDAAQLEGLSEQDLSTQLGDLWDKQRYIYQRIVRTETMNTYARASLQEWANAGYDRVIRNEMNDDRVCSYCRTVDGMEFKISDLLALEYPLIQDVLTKEFVGHPHCRGGFSLISSYEDWDYFVAPPGSGYETTDVVQVGGSQIAGVPPEFVAALEKALQENQVEPEIRVTSEIVDNEAWLAQERERIKREMEAEGQGASDMRIDAELEEYQESMRGQLATYTLDSGEILLSGASFYESSPSWLVLRQAARQSWSVLDEGVQAAVTGAYDEKKAMQSMTLEDDGLEIIGSPLSGRGFITPAAGVSPEEYYSEGYALYQTDSYKLEFLDMTMYGIMKDSVFNGKEFRGGMAIQ